MKYISIKGKKIGQGAPKICVSLIGKTKEEILEQAISINNQLVDIVEWRADWFSYVDNKECVLDVLGHLQAILKNIPILSTFRSKKEGGEKEISLEDYKDLNLHVAQSKLVDMIDIEVFMDKEIQQVIRKLKDIDSIIIGSYHNFYETPKKEEIMKRLLFMEKCGVDIGKIAVMPKEKEDVIELLDSTIEGNKNLHIPIITMSMGELGVISRISGKLTGSAITFGSLKKASAPGQIEVEKLKEIIETL